MRPHRSGFPLQPKRSTSGSSERLQRRSRSLVFCARARDDGARSARSRGQRHSRSHVARAMCVCLAAIGATPIPKLPPLKSRGYLLAENAFKLIACGTIVIYRKLRYGTPRRFELRKLLLLLILLRIITCPRTAPRVWCHRAPHRSGEGCTRLCSPVYSTRSANFVSFSTFPLGPPKRLRCGKHNSHPYVSAQPFNWDKRIATNNSEQETPHT